MEKQTAKQSFLSGSTWKRILFMVLYTILYGIAEMVVVGVAFIQVIFALFTGGPNKRMLDLGQNLATYIYQIIRFLTFNSEQRPYPMDSWPSGPPKDETPLAGMD